MHAYTKQKFNFVFKFIAMAIMFISVIYFSGCAPRETFVNIGSKQGDVNTDISWIEREQSGENDIDKWLLIGAEVKELGAISGIDDPAIIVNGYAISKREVITQKIYSEYLKYTTIKDGINSLIRAKALKAEADRLGIEPQREKIDAYLKQVDETLQEKTVGTETIFAYMEGLGITKEEYLSTLEDVTYDLYQREELWNSAKVLNNVKDYEQYVNEIVERAKIEIVDSETEKFLEW